MFKDNKILVLGFARSGYAAALFLAERGNKVYLTEIKDESLLDIFKADELREKGVTLILGEHPDDLLDSSFDYLIKNPGVPIDHKYVIKAQELGIEVINEVEMAFRLLPFGVKLIGITGTNGKTTTTVLTYNILKEAFKERVFLVGNVGYPLCSCLNQLNSDSIIVMEVSSQQLENMKDFRPDIAVMTNLSSAHIDFFKNYENYKNVKAKLFKNQTDKDVAILNIEDKDLCLITKDIKSSTKYFSSKNIVNGSYLSDGEIYYYDQFIMNSSELKIVGIHNLENCMAAIMIAKEFDVSNEVIREVLSSFKGVEHRLEYVDTVDGRIFYNDTEATNIKSTQIALSSFNKPIILILGGLERGQDFNELTPYIDNVSKIIAIGQCRERILEYGMSVNIPTYCFEHLTDGFDKCVEVSNSGDIILLSPASASWDQYKECEVRGAEFKKKVEELKNEN